MSSPVAPPPDFPPRHSDRAQPGCLTTSIEGEVLFHNPRLWELWGIPAEEAAAIAGAGRGAFGRFREAVGRRVARPDTFALPGSPDEVATGDVPLADGRVLERYSAPWRDGAGRVAGRACFFREVTAARRTGTETRELRLAAMVDGAPDAIVVVDAQGSIVEANPAAGRLWGRAREELAGAPIASVVEPGRAGEVQDLVRLLLEEGRLAAALDVRRPGEPTRSLELSGVAHVLPDRHLLVLRDVTERRRAQGRLALADRMASAGALAAGVAHELNNPLSYVSANVSFVAETLAGLPPAAGGAPPVGEMLDALGEARGGVERMRAVIRDLETFSRRGDEEEPVELRPVLESCLQLARNEIAPRAALVEDFEAVPPVPGNAARLGQAFLSLLVNAAQAVPEGHRDRNEVRVVVRLAPPGRVAVEIRDTGGGIPPDDLPRIFDPFFTTGQRYGRTGLGLAICHHVVSALGGEIQVESELGRGSVFRVLLPARAGERPPPSSRDPSAEGSRGRILVVDDEPLVGAAIRRALDAEHEIAVYSDARPALARIAAGARFDLVLCDLLMPGMSGMEFHREVARIDPALARRTLFITGGALTGPASSFLRREGVQWLEKPFDAETLRDAVRARLASPPG